MPACGAASSAVLSMPAGKRASNSAPCFVKDASQDIEGLGAEAKSWCRISAMKSSLTEPFFALAGNIPHLP